MTLFVEKIDFKMLKKLTKKYKKDNKNTWITLWNKLSMILMVNINHIQYLEKNWYKNIQILSNFPTQSSKKWSIILDIAEKGQGFMIRIKFRASINAKN